MVGTLLMLGCLLVGQQEASVADDLSGQVRRLVGQLDAPRLAQRDAAEAQLIDLGPSILPLLPSSKASLSAEARQRLGRLRRKLEQRLAAAAVEASHVTLNSGRMKLSKVLEAISRQTGNRVIDYRRRFGQEQSDPELTVDFDKTPFWKAIERILEQTDMNVYPYGPDRAVYLVGRHHGGMRFGGKADQAGPFLFLPSEMIAQRRLNVADGGSLQLTMLILWEPRAAPVGLTQKLKEIEAVDEAGNPLEVVVRLGELEVPVGPSANSVRLSIPFALPPRDVRKIARLSGTLDALVPGPVKTFRFDRLARAREVKQRMAGVTVTLGQVRKLDEIWEVGLRVRFDQPGDALASHRGWIFANETYMEGPDGKRLNNEGYETKMQTENEIGLAYFFDLGQSPDKYTFVYKTPVRIFTARFKYELKDLELP